MADKFEHKENRGSAFKNNKKDVATKPDFRGEQNVEGKLFWLNVWFDPEKNPPIHTSLTPKEPKP